MRDEVAVVMGGSRGIGAAVALELARQGAHVAVHYRQDAASAQEVVRAVEALGRKAIALCADLGERELPADFVASIEGQLGPIRHLVCAAGLTHEGMGAFMSLDDWDEVIQVNLRGAVLACQAFLPAMLRARQGGVVLLGSAAGTYGSSSLSAYAASKAGLVGFAKSLAQEVGPRHVRVNVVTPGFIATDMLHAVPEERRALYPERTALRRLGTPEEVAVVVAFLLSDAARYVTGAVVPVDGGLSLI